MKKTIAVIGAGNIGGKTIEALLARGFTHIIATNRTEESLFALQKRFPNIHTTTQNLAAARDADVIILSVKPKHLQGVCEEIKDVVHGKLVLSMAAATTLADLQTWLDSLRVALVMTGVFVKDEVAAYVPGADITKEDEETICTIYGAKSLCVTEEELSCRSYIGCDTGLIPKEIHEKIQTLKELGLSEKDAALFYAGTLRAMANALEEGMSGDEILHLVGAPGSFTLGIAQKLEAQGVYKLMQQHVCDMILACRKR